MSKVGRVEVPLDCRNECVYQREGQPLCSQGLIYGEALCGYAINRIARIIRETEGKQVMIVSCSTSDEISIYTAKDGEHKNLEDWIKVAEVRNGIIFIEKKR